MNGYFGYIRVSTAKQGEQGSSLQEQRRAIEEYAARQGLDIVEWFEERETAAKQGRARFNAMLAKLTKRQAAGVIIHKIDRSARNLRDWARLGDLLDRNVDVRFAHESLDLGSRGGRLAADIQAVVAADYVRNLRDEVRKGIAGRLNQGLYPLPAPIGYTDQGKGKRKEIDPITGPLVRKAFELYSTGSYSVDELRDEMTRRGLRNRRGSPLSRTGMWTVLRNPFYTGLIHIARTKRTYAGVHAPLVRRALFDRVQAILSGRTYAARTKHEFAYSRFIRCAGCGRSLIAELQKGHTYYRCHTPSCFGTSLREPDVAAGLAELFSWLTFDEGELGDLVDLRKASQAGDQAERDAAVTQAKLSLANCDDRLVRLTDAYLDGALDRDLFEHRKGALLAEKRGYQDIIEEPPKEGRTLQLLKKLELVNAAWNKAEFGNSPKTREAVSIAMSNLIADGKNLAFPLLFPFDQLLSERISSNGAPYQAEPRKRCRFRQSVGQDEMVIFRRLPQARLWKRAPLDLLRSITAWEQTRDGHNGDSG